MSITMRVAADWRDYPPLRSLPEPDLIPTIRVEFCACGQYVRQLAGDSIPDTVRRHNATAPHQAWRYSRGVSAGEVENTEQVPDNGGVSQPNIEDPTVSLPDRAVDAA